MIDGIPNWPLFFLLKGHYWFQFSLTHESLHIGHVVVEAAALGFSPRHGFSTPQGPSLDCTGDAILAVDLGAVEHHPISLDQALIERVVMLADTERRNGRSQRAVCRSNHGPWSKATKE